MQWLIFGTVLLATALQPTGRFLFDARGYWTAAGALIGSSEPIPEGFWDLRGVSSAVVFVPAQVVTRLLGADIAGFAVLLQNSLLIAAVAAFLAPAILSPWARLGSVSRWVTAGTLAFVARGFAPYPLMDLYAAAAVLLGIYLLYRRSWLPLLGSGLLLGSAFNMRPAYLVPIAIVAIIAIVVLRFRALLVTLGAFLALVPQMAYLAVTHQGFGLTPVASTALIGLQTSYASYTVRYDTALASHLPQQFFCSPTMAHAVSDPPLTISGLAGTFLTNLPHSAIFGLEKIGASLHWPLSIPYLVPNPGVNALVALIVTSVTVVGTVRLLSLPSDRGPRAARGLMAALVVGTVSTLVSSATEARFALLVALIGAIGLGLVVEHPFAVRTTPRRSNRDILALALIALLTIGLLLVGHLGLSRPAPPGGVTVNTCTQAIQ